MRRKPREEARKARNQVYREHVVQAAERAFAEAGFEAAKLQDISARAGLSMGTIYSVFPGGKAELFEALVEERGQELLALARDVAGRALPPRDALLRLGEAYIDWFVRHPDFLRMQLGAAVSWALGPGASAPSRVQFWREIHALQADICRRGVESGEFADEDPAYLAKLFSAIDEVVLADWVAGRMQESAARLVARLRTQVERSIFRAPAAPAKARAARA